MLTIHKTPPVRVVTHGEVSVVTLSGLITPSVLNDVRREIERAWGGVRPLAMVADLRGAVMAMAAPAMAAAAMAAPELRRLAVATVAHGQTADVIRDHAFLCAQQGVLRVVLPDVPTAIRWAQEQVELQRYRALQGED